MEALQAVLPVRKVLPTSFIISNYLAKGYIKPKPYWKKPQQGLPSQYHEQFKTARKIKCIGIVAILRKPGSEPIEALMQKKLEENIY